VVGLAVYVGRRYRAYVTAGAVGVAMVAEVLVKENLAGKEHLAAIAAVLALCAVESARQRRAGTRTGSARRWCSGARTGVARRWCSRALGGGASAVLRGTDGHVASRTAEGPDG
jgi:hypothetical protein